MHADHLINPLDAFTQAVRVKTGDITKLFISGQVGRRGDDLMAQSDRAYASMKGLLESAGLKPTDLVMQNIFITKYKQGDGQALGAASTHGLLTEGRNPSSTLVGIPLLWADGALIEVEALAIGALSLVKN